MAEIRKMTVAEGLNQLKLYDSRIHKKMSETDFVAAAKKSSDKVNAISKEIYEQQVRKNYQSVHDLIQERKKLKSAIIKSNAVTFIEIGGMKMTVAEAIERKRSIRYEGDLLLRLKTTYRIIKDEVLRENKEMEEQINKILEMFHGKETEKKPSKEEQSVIANLYREQNEYDIVDPINILNEMETLEEEIENFKSNVDAQLVISNATTYIEV